MGFFRQNLLPLSFIIGKLALTQLNANSLYCMLIKQTQYVWIWYLLKKKKNINIFNKNKILTYVYHLYLVKILIQNIYGVTHTKKKSLSY